MTTRAIILCAGSAERWGDYLGTKKHLITIEGERLLDRTVRLLTERGITDIHVITSEYNPLYNVTGATQSVVNVNRDGDCDTDKFLSSKHLWNQKGRTLVIYGDCYFTDEGMDTIVNYEPREWRLFCRPHASTITGTPWGECFAQSFYPEHLEEHEQALYRTIQLVKDGYLKKGGGWGHYRTMCGVLRGFPRERMVVVDDFCEDFDRESDLTEWLKRRKVYLDKL